MCHALQWTSGTAWRCPASNLAPRIPVARRTNATRATSPCLQASAGAGLTMMCVSPYMLALISICLAQLMRSDVPERAGFLLFIACAAGMVIACQRSRLQVQQSGVTVAVSPLPRVCHLCAEWTHCITGTSLTRGCVISRAQWSRHLSLCFPADGMCRLCRRSV